MIAVFLLDFGGPEKPDDVQPFLKNLFSDRLIFPFPFGQEIFAHIVAKARAPKVIQQYEKIGGGSPAPRQSKALAGGLEEGFQKANLDIKVFTGFRYWHPSIAETLAEIAKAKPQGMAVIPMFPHYSTATTLSVLQAFQEACKDQKLSVPYQLVEWWYDQPHYIAGWCHSIGRALDRFEAAVRSKVPILFTAHGLPKSFVTERNDPYPKQIRDCAEKVMTYLGTENPSYISYQSKVGPIEWLTPSTLSFVRELPKKGYRNLILVPISFLTDHIETLYEIDHEIIPAAKAAGIERAIRCEALCHGPYLRKVLEELILKRLPVLLKR